MNMLELNKEKEGCMSYTTPEDAQRPRAVYDIHLDFQDRGTSEKTDSKINYEALFTSWHFFKMTASESRFILLPILTNGKKLH